MKPLLAATALGLMLLAVPTCAGGALDEGSKAMHKHDFGRAFDLLAPLAKAGDPVAQYNLAVMLDEGRGLPQNYDKALDWYRRAADQGLIEAMYVTSYYYRRGRGRSQDTVEAYKWINLAAGAGLPHAAVERMEQEDQMTRARIAEGQARSLRWLADHRHPWTCPKGFCPRPAWLPKADWDSIFYWYGL